jgi:hypothetical protein
MRNGWREVECTGEIEKRQREEDIPLRSSIIDALAWKIMQSTKVHPNPVMPLLI